LHPRVAERSETLKRKHHLGLTTYHFGMLNVCMSLALPQIALLWIEIEPELQSSDILDVVIAEYHKWNTLGSSCVLNTCSMLHLFAVTIPLPDLVDCHVCFHMSAIVLHMATFFSTFVTLHYKHALYIHFELLIS
jgi:hypothetical protein